MSKQRMLLQKSGFIVLALFCTAFLVAKAWSSRTIASQNSRPRVENRTKAFDVIGIEKTEGYLLVSLKNGYSKNITAYNISIGNFGMQEDFIDSGAGIAPGNTHLLKIPLSNLPSDSDQSTRPLIVRAVMFGGRTGDGDPEAVAAIKDRRLGRKTQLKRILPLLQSALDSPQVDHTVLDRLRSQILSLPESGLGLSHDFIGGLRDTKEELLNSIRGLEEEQQQHKNLQNGLTEIKQYQERVLKKF